VPVSFKLDGCVGKRSDHADQAIHAKTGSVVFHGDAYLGGEFKLFASFHLDDQQVPQVIHHLAGILARVSAIIECLVNDLESFAAGTSQAGLHEVDHGLTRGSSQDILGN